MATVLESKVAAAPAWVMAEVLVMEMSARAVAAQERATEGGSMGLVEAGKVAVSIDPVMVTVAGAMAGCMEVKKALERAGVPSEEGWTAVLGSWEARLVAEALIGIRFDWCTLLRSMSR